MWGETKLRVVLHGWLAQARAGCRRTGRRTHERARCVLPSAGGKAQGLSSGDASLLQNVHGSPIPPVHPPKARDWLSCWLDKVYPELHRSEEPANLGAGNRCYCDRMIRDRGLSIWQDRQNQRVMTATSQREGHRIRGVEKIRSYRAPPRKRASSLQGSGPNPDALPFSLPRAEGRTHRLLAQSAARFSMLARGPATPLSPKIEFSFCEPRMSRAPTALVGHEI